MNQNYNRKIEWKEILKGIMNNLSIENKFIYKGKVYEYRFVGFADTRLGYMVIWEEDTKRALHMSRLKIPNDFSFIDINDDEELVTSMPDDLKIEAID